MVQHSTAVRDEIQLKHQPLLSPKQKKKLRDQQRQNFQQSAKSDLQDKMYNLAYANILSTHQLSIPDRKSIASLKAICDEDYNYFCFLTESESMQDMLFLFCDYLNATENNQNKLKTIFMNRLTQLAIKYYIDDQSEEIEQMLHEQKPYIEEFYARCFFSGETHESV